MLAVTEDTTHAELAEALGHMLGAARREFPKVGTAAQPTPWDTCHQALDMLLVDYERATS